MENFTHIETEIALFGGRLQILPEQVVMLEADINYTIFYLEDGQRILSSFTLKHHAANIHLQHFVRVHKSFLLNPNHIEGLYREGKIVSIRMSDGRELKVARRKKALISEQLGIKNYVEAM